MTTRPWACAAVHSRRRRAIPGLDRCAGYEPTALAATDAGWPLVDLAADNHFLSLAEEVRVAEAILSVLPVLLR